MTLNNIKSIDDIKQYQNVVNSNNIKSIDDIKQYQKH